MFGWFYTYQPSVPNLNTQFSLTHLYPFTNSGTSFVEVGVYRGFGPEKIASNSSFYTSRADSVTSYQEKNFRDAPADTFVAYEAQYEGFNFSTNKYIWGVYADDLVNRLWTWENKDLGMGIALSGGEVNARGVEMRSRIIPSHQLKLDSTWHNWTESFMSQQGDFVRTCDEPDVVWSYNVKFDDYQLSGTIR